MASNASLTGGYDCEFVETPPDKLMCQICLSVAHTPHQMPCCGRVYCKACLDTHKRLSNTCPNCRSTRQSFPDTRGESKSWSDSKIVLDESVQKKGCFFYVLLYLNTIRSNSMVLKMNNKHFTEFHRSLVLWLLCPLMVTLGTLYTLTCCFYQPGICKYMADWLYM